MSKHREPVFLTKVELATHLGCAVRTVDRWIAAGTVPPPHSRPGPQTALWLRRHFTQYVETGAWPKEAYVAPSMKRVESSSPRSK